MSDNDTISRKWLLEQYDAQHEGPAGRARKLIEDAPAVPHEMTAREYARNIERMCDANLFCGPCSQACPMRGKVENAKSDCSHWIMEHPEEAVAIVAQWAKDHPEKRKTYAEDFASKFPKAWGNSDGVPYVCRDSVYEGHSCRHEIKDCSACWQEEMEDDDENN